MKSHQLSELTISQHIFGAHRYNNKNIDEGVMVL